MPTDIKQNIEQFRRSIRQWTQGLHGPKTLTEGNQVSIRAYFQDYMIKMNITDIKQVGQRLEFGTKREEPVLQYYQHRIYWPTTWSVNGPSRSPPPSKRQYRDDEDRSHRRERDPSHDRKHHDRLTDGRLVMAS